jgi:hypothetical protein
LQSVDNRRELLSREAIKEEVRRDQIVAFGWRIPRGELSMDEFYSIDWQRGAAEPPSGDIQHACAGVHTGHLRIRVMLQQRSEKPPMAFADQERAFERREITPKGVATLVEFGAREQRFHPVVVLGEGIEARGGSGPQRVCDPAGDSAAIPPGGARECAE